MENPDGFFMPPVANIEPMQRGLQVKLHHPTRASLNGLRGTVMGHPPGSNGAANLLVDVGSGIIIRHPSHLLDPIPRPGV